MSWWARDARKEARDVLRFIRRFHGHTINDVEVYTFPGEDYAEFYTENATGSITPDTADYLAAMGATKLPNERPWP